MTVPNDRPWTVRPYRPGDEKALTALFERANGRPITADHWLWKLKGSPSPTENVWLAVVDDQPIFQYSALPVTYRLPGGERTVMTSVDIMTDPAWQRQGILTAVGQGTFDRWQDAGIPFTLGLPNERWGSRTTALGWEPLFPLRWYKRLLRPAAIAGRKLLRRPGGNPALSPVDTLFNRLLNRPLPTDPSLTIARTRVAGEGFDDLWARCATDTAVSVVRDRAWVAWRFLAAPEADYHLFLASRRDRPAGYIVTRLLRDGEVARGVIAEWLAPRDDPTVAPTMLRHAVDHLAGQGAQSIATLAVPGTPAQRLLRQGGFIGRAAFTVRYAPFDRQLPSAVMKDRHQWRIFGGDFDVV